MTNRPHAVGAFQVLVTGFGEAQPPAAVGPGELIAAGLDDGCWGSGIIRS
jgi:hypothetical protein